MNDIKDIGKYLTSAAFIGTIIMIIIMSALLSFIKKYLIKKVAYTTKGEQHQNTFIGVLFGILQYLVVIVGVIIILKINGVNVTSIVAGLGIVATLVGLALQDTMKDVISGINIYNNNFYKVGDLVMYNGNLCEVKYFSARVTKFQDFYTHSTYTVCNSIINSIEKVKDTNIVIVSFDFEDDKKKIMKCFDNALKVIEKDKYVKEVLNLGIIEINNNAVDYACLFVSPAHKTPFIKMDLYNSLFDEFKKAKLSPNFSDEIKLKKMAK